MRKSKDTVHCQPICLVCESLDYSTFHRFDEWKVIRCMNCTLLYIHPLPSKEHLFSIADDSHSGAGIDHIQHYFSAHDLSNHHDPVVQSFSTILDLLEESVEGRRLLDVGSGDGTFVALAIKRGWDAFALDCSPIAGKVARESYGVETLTYDFCSDGVLVEEHFDVVTMLDFLEHVIDPITAVRQARELIQKDGVFLVNSPNHQSVLCWVIDSFRHISVRSVRNVIQRYYGVAHVSIFNPRSLAHLLKKGGFAVEVVGENSPVLDRLAFSLPVRLILRLIILVGKLLRRQSRVWVLARAATDLNCGRK